MTAPSPPDYFRAVERAFLELRGGGMFLAPADWDLVRQWEERGVPLDAVVAGIRAALADRVAGPVRSGRPRSPSRMPLGACRAAVEREFDVLRRRRTGAAAPPAAGAASATNDIPLKRLAERLRAWSPDPAALSAPEAAHHLAARARAAADRLERIGPEPGGPPAAATQTLEDIRNELVAELEAALPAPARGDIEADVRRTLAPYRTRMPAAAWRDACRQAFRRRVAEAFGLDSIPLPD